MVEIDKKPVGYLTILTKIQIGIDMKLFIVNN